MEEHTIYALSTAPGRAGVAVFRISGAQAKTAIERLTVGSAPAARTMELRRLIDPKDGALIDRGLVAWFQGPGSFTGEDVVELHIHGGVAVCDALTQALEALPQFRMAEAGEFTRRAFRNGKLDLAEAEGIGDLIDADTAAARRQALWQLEGGLSAHYVEWTSRLLDIRAHAEAALDFSDEPIPDDIEADASRRVRALAEEFRAALAAPSVGERLRDGVRVALVGAPNVGKSSIMNAIAGRDVSIVATTAGTTRDAIEVRLDLEGFPVIVHDTAGMRETDNPIEMEGIRRAKSIAAAADVVVEVRDMSDPTIPPLKNVLAPGAQVLRFWNKADLVTAPGDVPSEDLVGAATQEGGLDALIDRLTQWARSAMEGEPAVITRTRHRTALAEGLSALEDALSAPAPELAAEDLRRASFALGRVTGSVDVEDVLDRIFGAFCIGK